jgi:hypothetical protein
MRTRFLLLLILSLLMLVACTTDSDDNETADATPTIPPTPTSVFASSFGGPRLNAGPERNTAADCSLDPDADGCGVGEVVEVDDALPLPLLETSWEDIVVMVPDGFDTLEFNQQYIIEALDPDAYPGSFTMIISKRTSAELEETLSNFVNLDNARQTTVDNGLGEGYTTPNSNRGMVGVWPLEADLFLLVRASVSPGYWPAYAATFNAIVRDLRFITQDVD